MTAIYFKAMIIAFTILSGMASASDTQINDPAALCGNCHQQQVKAWQQSHHFHAMEPAGPESILAAFTNEQITYLGRPARFFRQDDQYLVTFFDEHQRQHTLSVVYTFGYRPLQQYLFRAESGKLQLIPFAWDSRSKAEGGQRWFILHPEQSKSDSFHWTQMGQNWNQMCADCHSTNFEKHFNSQSNTYQSTYASVNVSCDACHGSPTRHLAWAKGDQGIKHRGFDTAIKAKTSGFHPDENGALVPVTPLQASRQIETCATCHARRAQLGDRQAPDDLFNAFQPSLLTTGLYFPDGQIQDEVYVWGSFVQSKMYQAGVTCTNCHNPHSGQLKLSGNQTCTQCHTSATYDSEQHHHHQAFNAGNQCVDCHMSATTYMQVDPRRDHSFRVPRPDLTQTIGTPNACNGCHQDQSAQWAQTQLHQWFPASQLQNEQHFATVFHAADQGMLTDSTALSRIAQNSNTPEMIRASALSRMASMPPDANAMIAITRAVKKDEPLQRMGAIQAAGNFPLEQRWRLLNPLLHDPRLSIRTEAARALAPMLLQPASQLTPGEYKQLNAGLREYQTVQRYQADRGYAHTALGNLALSLQQIEDAIGHFNQAIDVEPIFIPAYVNLADTYRLKQDEAQSRHVLTQGLALAPEAAALNYAMAMSLVRSQNKPKAATYLQKAAEAEPESLRYHYTYSLLLKDIGQPMQAIQALKRAYHLSPNNPDLVYTLSQSYAEVSNYQAALFYAAQLRRLLPDNPQVAHYIEQLQARSKR
ncbi:tetratricopeptide repeat protein [Photobacterium atrarenae]|uniref:Tetratricopeptide repeat protein n=1 Tax=Photobacterium atrarenae TaxID=865757 RepID=A0ABY5GM77_9GAMM|nr:multiheme c-type cytochrome [Photobacterium atrarenae]UTV29652.1 tetratricopeptide repeat protein [Photobacterium atrarenae]